MSGECSTCGHDMYEPPCAWCAVTAERDRYREALVEAASAAREVHAVVIGSDCDEHDPALKAVIWAQRVEAAVGLALDATSGRKGGPA